VHLLVFLAYKGHAFFLGVYTKDIFNTQVKLTLSSTKQKSIKLTLKSSYFFSEPSITY